MSQTKLSELNIVFRIFEGDPEVGRPSVIRPPYTTRRGLQNTPTLGLMASREVGENLAPSFGSGGGSSQGEVETSLRI